MTNEENNVKEQNEKAKKGCLILLGQMAVVFVVFAMIVGFIDTFFGSETTEQQPKTDPHKITKETFNGEWAFTVDEVELHKVKINEVLSGIEVIIPKEGTFALTRNLKTEFLPNKYWKDYPLRKIDQYEVCDAVMLDEKTCKVSLGDVIKYADTLND